MHLVSNSLAIVLLAATINGAGIATAEDKATMDAAGTKSTYVPNQIDYSMFHESFVFDTPECDAHIVDGVVVFGETVSNPAMSCPNAFAWKRFVETIGERWWDNWSTDRQTWPSDPWPRCALGETENCCASVEMSNETWPKHCPVYPGAADGLPDRAVRPPSKAHQVPRTANMDRNGDGTVSWNEVPAGMKSIVMAQEQYEIVYRNAPTVAYTFDRSLYYTEGLAHLYENSVKAQRAYAPRQASLPDPSAVHPTPPPVTTVVFPINSVIVKASWMEADIAPDYGIDPYDRTHPFIVMDLVPKVDADADSGSVEKKPFILLSFSITTKDVPKWFWSMFEHVANQGRCDWTGCNDVFGYPTVETSDVDTELSPGLPPPARNYTPPKKLTAADGAAVTAFDLATRYLDADSISDPLAAMFANFDIGSASELNASGRPTVQDQAWRSYRLKGTQTDFSGFTGRPLRLGGSVSEAGFVNSSSCVSCHARAAVREGGLSALSTFVDAMSVQGVPKGAIGVPNERWFNVTSLWGEDGATNVPLIHGVQTDFMWGIKYACPVNAMSVGQSWCANVTSTTEGIGTD